MAIILPALTSTVHVYLLLVAITPCEGKYWLIIFEFIMNGYSYIYTAASLTTNIDGEACQGKVWILTCTGRSHTHRWTHETAGNEPIVMTHVASRSVPGTDHMGSYNFTLISATNNWFESSVSTVLATALNNTVAKCADIQSEVQPVTIRIAGQ